MLAILLNFANRLLLDPKDIQINKYLSNSFKFFNSTNTNYCGGFNLLSSLCYELIQKCGTTSHSFSMMKHKIRLSETNLNVVMFRFVYK